MKPVFILILLVALFFVSCDTNDVVYEAEVPLKMDVVSEGKSIKDYSCDSLSSGRIIYDSSVDIPFVCDGFSWKKMKGENGLNGINGKDGIDGIDGVDGSDGNDGAFCTVTNYGTSVYLNCNGDTMTVSFDWDYSSSCYFVADNDSLVAFDCNGDTLVAKRYGRAGDGKPASLNAADSIKIPQYGHKCGSVFYDENVMFCAEGNLVEKCNGLEYDILKEKCMLGVVVSIDFKTESLCGSSVYLDDDFHSCDEKKGIVFGSVVDRSGRSYKTVIIGEQEWMAENYALEVQGSWQNTDERFGLLYSWPAMMDLDENFARMTFSQEITSPYQGICPDSWHVPSIHEALALKSYVDGHNGSEANASSLKSRDWEGSDRFGFNALPSGGYNDCRDFRGIWGCGSVVNGYADFWTITEKSDSTSHYFYVDKTDDIKVGAMKKYSARALRCVKDKK